MSSISSKKRTKTSLKVVKLNSFVRFLEEKIILILSDLYLVTGNLSVLSMSLEVLGLASFLHQLIMKRHICSFKLKLRKIMKIENKIDFFLQGSGNPRIPKISEVWVRVGRVWPISWSGSSGSEFWIPEKSGAGQDIRFFRFFAHVKINGQKWITWIISKTHHSILKILLVLGADENLERLEDKIRKCLFFCVKIF